MSLLLEKKKEQPGPINNCPLDDKTIEKIENEINNFLNKMCEITGKGSGIILPFPECIDSINVKNAMKYIKDNALYIVRPSC